MSGSEMKNFISDIREGVMPRTYSQLTLDPYKSPMKWRPPPLTNKEPEEQRGGGTGPRSHSRSKMDAGVKLGPLPPEATSSPGPRG